MFAWPFTHIRNILVTPNTERPLHIKGQRWQEMVGGRGGGGGHNVSGPKLNVGRYLNEKKKTFHRP